MKNNKILLFIKIRKEFILFSLLRVLIMILGLVTNIFIVRKLSVNDYGIFSVAFMLVGLVTTFGFSWSSSSILYYGSKEKARYGSINKTFWARNIIIVFSIIIVTLIFIVFSKEINSYIGLDVSFLILIWLYVSVTEDYLSKYFLAINKQILSVMLSVTAKIVYLILIFIIQFDVRSLFLLNIISQATVIFYILKINKKDIGRFEFDRLWFKEILDFSLWQLFGFSGIYLINFGDTAVIKYFMTTEDVGIYNAAYKLFNAIVGFSFVISNYFASNISLYYEKKDYKKIKNFFYKERFIIFAASIGAHIITIIFSKQIIVLLYGDRYIQASEIFYILMIGSIFSYLSVFYFLYYNINKKYKILQILNIFQAILNITLDIIFINCFGIIGPAIATTSSIIITSTYSIVYCEKRIKKDTLMS
ncbi:lipopolysaccharide biosynthesis protein [Caloranaerobacter sp. DY30410]|uniref:lipopolysaccharide biosynthesis protein n=1 Tax=Caloranaerobacter sp. DY30410 TaxID=3238305 RepID=UPI003D072A7F